MTASPLGGGYVEPPPYSWRGVGGVMAEVVSVSLEPLATVGGEWCGIETDGIGVDKELKCSC